MNSDLLYTYGLMGILIFSFVLNPFFKKKASKGLGSNEYLLINHLIITLLIILYAIYLFSYNKCDMNCVRSLDKGRATWAVFAGVTSVIGAIVLIKLVQRDEITFIIPNVQPLVILIGALIGYYIFNESMRSYKVLGIFLVILGAIFINIDKIKNSI